MARAFEIATEQLGGITVAVNCTGIVQAQRVLGAERLLAQAEFARVIAVNLIGAFTVCRAAANRMQHNEPNAEGERGVIINTASIAAYEGQIGQAAYAASKGGVASLTLPLAREPRSASASWPLRRVSSIPRCSQACPKRRAPAWLCTSLFPSA
ncbi:hypothetical protein BH20PSE1_BH20PSE1_22910 [soil metagenome]